MSTSHSDRYNEARTKWPTSWDISLKLSYISKSINGCHRGCLNNPIFSNLGLCAACWTHFMCHHELGPTSVSHPFCFLNSSSGLDGEQHYQKITIPIFRLVLQRLLFQVTFLIFFSTAILLLTFSRLVCYCSMWAAVKLPSSMTSQLNRCPHFFLFLFYFLSSES